MYSEIRIFFKIAWHMLQVAVLWFVSGIRHKATNYMETVRNIVNQWKQPDEVVRMMNYPYGNSCIWFNDLRYTLLVPTNQRVLSKSGKWQFLLCSLLDLLHSVRFFGTSNMQWYTMCPNEWVTTKSLADFVWLFGFLCQIEIKLMIIIGNDRDDIMSLFLSTYILRSSYFWKIWTLYVLWVTSNQLYYALYLIYWALFVSFVLVICSRTLCDSNVIRTDNHLVCKRTLNHLAKLA